MSGSKLVHSALVAVIWIYTVFAAPVEEEGPMMENNMTGSCFKDALPQELQLHYDMCLGNNLGGDNMIRETDILACILKTAGVISEEEIIDTSKLKMPAAEEEEEASDMKMMVEDNPFILSVEKCEANENVEKAEDFALCLHQMLSMNCTTAMPSEQDEAEKMSEEN